MPQSDPPMSGDPRTGARPRTPDDSHRVAIIGKTGTGKTAAGIFHLAWRSFDRMPWLAINYKGDAYLSEAVAAARGEELGTHEKIPDYPGLYHVRPIPEDGSIDALLLRAWARGNVGFYIDECYDVGQHSKPLRRVLTQGRALRVPVILCSQRPVWVSKFAITEADFFQVFNLIDVDDRKPICRRTGLDINYPEMLPDYCSFYADLSKTQRRLAMLGPVPYGPPVLDIFDKRRPPPRRGTKRL